MSAALPTTAATARAGPSNGPSAFSPGHTPASMSTAWTDQDEAGGREGGEIHGPAGAFVGSAVISGAGGQGRLSLGPYLGFIARVTSHIPDKGQVMVRYYGLYANAHRGMIKKASLGSFPIRMVEEELQPIPSKGWAEMIRKVYEVDPMLCPNSEASSRTAKRCPKCGSFAVLMVCMSAVE